MIQQLAINVSSSKYLSTTIGNPEISGKIPREISGNLRTYNPTHSISKVTVT